MIFGLFKRGPKDTPGGKGEAQEVKGEVVGEATHYFSHCKACVVKLKIPLSVGDNIYVKGHTTDFKQKVTSLQIDGKDMTSANKGDEVGLLVKDRVRAGDTIYKI